MSNQEIIDAIIAGKTKSLSYCTYPSYSGGDTIYEGQATDQYNLFERGAFKPSDKNLPIVNAIDKIISDAADKLETRRDNKTAVKVELEDGTIVYVRNLDSNRNITTGINMNKGNREIPLP